MSNDGAELQKDGGCGVAFESHQTLPSGKQICQIGCSQTGDGKNELDILGISELKWTGVTKFDSNDHCIYYCG